MNDYNQEIPLVMHVDLNSAFATIEQQARPMLRNKPVAVINRKVENTAIVTASYEAKSRGVKVGMRFKDAARLCPGLVALESDPEKYRFVYKKLASILGSYSPNFVMKSIDEGVIDFHNVPLKMSLVEIGMEIKARLREEVGSYMKCNVGIGTNRFLAKMAASLHKPDGLDIIDNENLRQVMGSLKLTDLTGIAGANQARLNSVGIYTPLEFLDAKESTLRAVVFKSIVGTDWYKRLRGFEVDDRQFDIKRVGRQYVLDPKTVKSQEILERLHNLCESVGSRMRTQGLSARGVYVYARSYRAGYWHACQFMQLPFYSDKAIYNLARTLFAGAPEGVREIGVHCYNLSSNEDDQISLFGDAMAREKQLMAAVDTVNQRYGEHMLHSADTLPTIGSMKVKITFGSIRYL